MAARVASHSLRGRLLWLLLIAVALAAVIQAAVGYRSAVSEANEIFDYQMEQIALALRRGSPRELDRTRLQHKDEAADLDFLIHVWAPDGTLVFASAPAASFPRPPHPGFSEATVAGVRYRVFSTQTPARTIQVAQDVTARRNLVADLVLRVVGPGIVLSPVLMLAVWWVVTRSTAPLARVREQVARRAADELDPLRVPGLPDEVRPLVDEINLLFTRLSEAFDAQRSFVANAAHELRSPLAALRLQIQGVQRAADREAQAVATRRMLAGVDRMARLVDQMLVLARQDAVEPSNCPSIDLRSVVNLAICDVVTFAHARRIDLGLVGVETASVAGEQDALRVLFRNLLENAIKYSPPAGTVDVTIGSDKDRPCVAIADSGPGIAENERKRVFDRFYRVPGATAAGSGLGLAIVQKIASRHRADVALETSRFGGLLVTITFPRRIPPAADGFKTRLSEL